jgi:hypothetical protein
MRGSNYKLNETIPEARERLGKWARFLVWNGTVYALESIQPVVVAPAQRASHYSTHQVIFDNIIAELGNAAHGAWVYVRERRQWYCMPISVVERRAIATFDPSAMEYLPINTPKEPVFPL